MKRLAWLVCLFWVGSFAAQAQQKKEENVKGPKIAFEDETHSFGDITQGDKVQHVFAFTNNGTEPLVISRVMTTCGCTAPNWPKEPIAPGEKGEITISFNSAGKMGMQNKVITIVSNAANSTARISITANVLPKKDAGK